MSLNNSHSQPQCKVAAVDANLLISSCGILDLHRIDDEQGKANLAGQEAVAIAFYRLAIPMIRAMIGGRNIRLYLYFVVAQCQRNLRS